MTIYDIAQEANVSVATVSRVMTGSAKVSEEKREKVETLIRKYDFKPNALAKGLSETKSKILGIMVADIRNPFYATLFMECEKEAGKYGYSLILYNTLSNPDLEVTYLEKMISMRVEAVIKIGGRIDDVVTDMEYVEQVNKVANSIPIVITGKLDGADCYSVRIDAFQATDLVMEHLFSLGHTDIAMIGGSTDTQSTVERYMRYKQQLRRRGIQIRDEYMIHHDYYDDRGGYECMKNLLLLEDRPSAVIAVNDFTAVGAMRAMAEAGIRVPNDMSVISYDDTIMANIMIPKLTSVSYNYENFGQMIIETVLKAINGEEQPRLKTIISELSARDSCGPCTKK
ncbi:MAG: LacI family transcriptional regulator [Anaerolineaceae bacterium]|nr:MAG: LacI family transcriptional regulator [Anaerolineaceae bacterium]